MTETVEFMRLFTLYGVRSEHKCGWKVAVQDACKVEYGDVLWTWMRWGPRLSNKNRETGEPVMCMEWVPHLGTRAEFIKEFREQFELWMLHVHRDRVLKFMLRLQAEHMTSPERMANPTVGNMRADFAAGIEIIRAFSATCAFASLWLTLQAHGKLGVPSLQD
jgi:hypothetical protein